MASPKNLGALLDSLRGRRHPVTAAQLAAEFGRSERTIYRDLAFLRAQGVRIDGAPGFGYLLRSDRLLSPLLLTALEAEALLLSLRAQAESDDPRVSPAARSSAAKIAALLPEPAQGALWLNRHPASPPCDVDGLAATIRGAIRSGHKLGLDYTDAEGQRTERIVWPIATGLFGATEILAAWCELRSAFRHFSLRRIAQLETLGVLSPRPLPSLFAEWETAHPGKLAPGCRL